MSRLASPLIDRVCPARRNSGSPINPCEALSRHA